jgi:uncharacterized protein (TIGR03435 family)
MTSALPACLLIVIVPSVYGQPADKPLSFDAASIKPDVSAAAGGRGGPAGGTVRIAQGTVVGRKATARRIILTAYRLSDYQLSGGPGWLDSDTFDLNAKADTPAQADQLRQMLQTLLAERFKLAVHRGTREMPVYALTVGKNGPGPNLHEEKEGQERPTLKGEEKWGSRTGRPGPTIVMRGHMPDFARGLSGDLFYKAIGRPVVDETGLKGIYDGFLHWLEIDGSPGVPDDGDIIPALQDEFGLKLESRKASVEILVIDHIERPNAN